MEQELDKAKLNVRKAAAEMVELANNYPHVVRDCVRQGRLPALIAQKFNIDLPVDISDVIQRYHDTRANR